MTMWRPGVAHRALVHQLIPHYGRPRAGLEVDSGLAFPGYYLSSPLCRRLIYGRAGCSCLAPLDTVHLELYTVSLLSVQRFEIPSIWECFLINLINFQESIYLTFYLVDFQSYWQHRYVQCRCKPVIKILNSVLPLDIEKSSKEPKECACTIKKNVEESQNKWEVLELWRTWDFIDFGAWWKNYPDRRKLRRE